MKRRIFSLILILTLLFSFSLIMTVPSGAATEEQIQASIDSGLAWLVTQQNPTSGGWYGELATTSFAVLKLLDRAYELDKDPFQTNVLAEDYYMYHENVILGLDFMFINCNTYGPGTGITFTPGYHETYNTGIAIMAIAASRTPDRLVGVGPFAALTYQELVQECVAYLDFAQLDDGAWRYWYLDDASDNSNTGYVALGLMYAREFGCDISGIDFNDPDGIGPKQGLSQWLDLIQDDVDGDFRDGGSWYTADWAWVNIYKTGNLLVEFGLVGDTVGVQRVDDAVDYIERNWNEPNDESGYPQWQNNYLSMYSIMKGFEVHGIETITVDAVETDWFMEIADYLLANQLPDGSWPSDWWCDSVLTTELALLTLEKIAPPPVYNYYVTATPECSENPVMTEHTVTATVWRDDGDPELDDVVGPEGVLVCFEVISGPNTGIMMMGTTDINGEVAFTYLGSGGGGTDLIRVWLDKDEDSECDEGELFTEVTKDWLVHYVTGGGNVKVGKGSPQWSFAGNVGYLDDEELTIKGQFQINDHVNKVSWHCHNDFSSLVFSGDPAITPDAQYNTATFTGTFTSNKGDETILTITIVDRLESGSKPLGDSIVVVGGPAFSSDPISSGNFQVHCGYSPIE